ncbi:hypothetical protein [Pelagicoccus sp. SDUM812003]|uniref:hypothetical protein n=1 Tax=Pelagicoccus sp. SDUM812003 TaxID=3041267 RepID=UPI00280DF774|nr:hypothetical protein [Pelagicoccus sp. SDUM812003]MDQ8202965.1 hypothetical protein [Pelagicoccus sp. SDUM812003]
MNDYKDSLDVKIAAGLVKARRAFFKLSLREKALLSLFLLALVGVWFSWQVDRHGETGAALRSAKSTAEEQQLALSYLPGIEEDYRRLISQINLSELPSKYEVSSRVDALVRQAGFSDFDLGQARTESGTGFNFHTIQLLVERATYKQIKSFTQTLKRELPYVSLERIIIQAQNRDDQFLNVRYVLKSIESTGNENS